MVQCHQNPQNQTIVTPWHHALKQNTVKLMKIFKWWCNGTNSWHRIEWVEAGITRCQFPFRLAHTAMQICYKLVLKWRIRISAHDRRALKLIQVSNLRIKRLTTILRISFVSVVYPSGGMLEMSNGYPSSPLGPSPSPSPVLGGHHNSKCKSETHTTNKFCAFYFS